MNLDKIGKPPDYRFSFANERTFLAWIRTALGFLVAGVALDQLSPAFATRRVGEGLILVLYGTSAALATYGYRRWRRNEQSMRLNCDLPYTRFLVVLSLIVLAINLVVAWSLFHG